MEAFSLWNMVQVTTALTKTLYTTAQTDPGPEARTLRRDSSPTEFSGIPASKKGLLALPLQRPPIIPHARKGIRKEIHKGIRKGIRKQRGLLPEPEKETGVRLATVLPAGQLPAGFQGRRPPKKEKTACQAQKRPWLPDTFSFAYRDRDRGISGHPPFPK